MASIQPFYDWTKGLGEEEEKMPVLFIGHGSPMNAIEDNEFSKRWQQMGKEIRNQSLPLNRRTILRESDPASEVLHPSAQDFQESFCNNSSNRRTIQDPSRAHRKTPAPSVRIPWCGR